MQASQQLLITGIPIFSNPQPFFLIQKFPVHTQRIQIEFAYPQASDDIRIHSKETWLTRSTATNWFIVRQETGHDFARSSDSKISGFAFHMLSDSLRICFFKIHSGERIQKYSDSFPN